MKSHVNVYLLGTILLLTSILLGACTETIVVGSPDKIKINKYGHRSTRTVIDDQLIEFRAASVISRNKSLKKVAHVNITSYNHIVLITGEVKTAKLRSHIEDLVRSVPKVRRIHNALVVGANTTRTSRLRDSWITTKAKTSLFKIREPGFNPTRIKVVTENKTVFLMGLVTPAAGAAAVAVIRKVSGVAKVVTVFEYIK